MSSPNRVIELLRDMPHVPQSDGYLINFRFTSGAIGVHNANTLETDSNLLERVTMTGEARSSRLKTGTDPGQHQRPTANLLEPLFIDKSMNSRLTSRLPR